MNTPRRLLLVTPFLPRADAANGGPLVLYNEVLALSEHYAVTLATFAGPEPGDRAGIQLLRDRGIAVHVIWRDAPVGRARWQRRGRLAYTWLRSGRPLRVLEFCEPRMQHLLDRLLAEQCYRLIQVASGWLGAYDYGNSCPIVLVEHEVQPRPTRRTAPLVRLRETELRRWWRHELAFCRRCERIAVFTSRDAATLSAEGPDLASRLRINPFGVALPPPTDPQIEEPNTVVFVGGFAHAPNVDAAIWLVREILPLLRAQRPAIRLLIVGADPPPAVRALAFDDKSVIVTGRVPQVEPFLDLASVVVAPLRHGGGMRVKVLQALAMGKAVVTTPLGAEGLALQDTAAPLVIAEGAPEIAFAVARLLAAPAERRNLGQRARSFVASQHSNEAYETRLMLLHDEIRLARREDRVREQYQ